MNDYWCIPSKEDADFVACMEDVFDVHEHRNAIDWTMEIKYLSDEMYPDAKKIILVMDNLNTHKAASLYKAFPPAEARRIIKRLEIHYTPKHGSWLDMAEIELNLYPVLTSATS